MAEVCLGLGSNLGDRMANLRRAQEALSPFFVIEKRSRVIETEPELVRDQPRFLNMVVTGRTELAPDRLLEELKALERRLGRKPGRRYGPRQIDLDILLYDDRIVESPDLVIPHARMHERRFVLEPMAEIAPEKRHPRLGLTMVELLARLRRSAEMQ